jgi:hypothetical protein
VIDAQAAAEARVNIEVAATADIAAVRERFKPRLDAIEEDQTHAREKQTMLLDQVRSGFADMGAAALLGGDAFTGERIQNKVAASKKKGMWMNV